MQNYKVFVAAPISIRKDYAIHQFFDNVRNYSYSNKKFYWVDNFFDETYHLKLIAQYGFDIDYVSPKSLTSTMYMTASMNMILDKFIKSDCDYLLLNECDVICDTDVIEKLISHDKLICAVPYFIGKEADAMLVGTGIDDVYGQFTNRFLHWKEDFKNFDGKLEKVNSAGFGCTLIKRVALDGYKFHANHLQKFHCDTNFYMDCFDYGVDVYRDNSMIATHLNSGWGNITDR